MTNRRGQRRLFAFGKVYTPGTAWPRFGVKSWTRTVDYETLAMRDEYIRADGDPTPRGGGAALPPGTKATQAFRGTHAGTRSYDNIERLKLAGDTILPLHGRKVPLSELQKWIGTGS